ncbi:hypothetical protein D3C84_1126740 [compost metagenome]
MKESDVITQVDVDFDVIKVLVETVLAKAVEDYWNDEYMGIDAVELAAFFDERLRKEGIAMKFNWLWSRAVTVLNE